MIDVAIQLYTLRDVDESLPDLLDRVGETAFDGLVDLGGRTALHEFADRSGDALGLQVDSGWVKSGGGDPAAFVRDYADRVDTVHVTDCDAASATPVEIGEGDVDLEACLGAARDAHVDALVYEHDEPDDPLGSLAHGSAYLAE